MAQLPRDHRAEIRILEIRLILAPAHHHLRTAAMAAVAGVEGADDTGVLHALGHLRHELADAQTGDIRADVGKGSAGHRAGLGIPRLQLTGAAREPEQNHALLAAFQRTGQPLFTQRMHRARRAHQPCRAHRAEKRPAADIVLSRSTKVVALFHKPKNSTIGRAWREVHLVNLAND